MKKLDETEIIKKFQKKFGNRNFSSEDVEFFSIGDTKIIVKVDTLVASTDVPSQMSLKDAARKSVVACVSDFAAKGVKPKFGIISIVLPSGISNKKIDEIASGFQKASKEFRTQRQKDMEATTRIIGKKSKAKPKALNISLTPSKVCNSSNQ